MGGANSNLSLARGLEGSVARSAGEKTCLQVVLGQVVLDQIYRNKT